MADLSRPNSFSERSISSEDEDPRNMASGASVVALLLKKVTKSEYEKRILNEIFDQADKNRDGQVDPKEYINAIQRRGIAITPEEVQEVFNIADKNNDGFLDRSEFCIEEFNDGRNPTRSELAFKIYDQNGDGQIDQQEMASISGKKLTKTQIENVFKVNDTDKDGKLSYQEFSAMIDKGKNRLKNKKADN
ncbi:uncharacterized protein [Lepeophtheirus salmonis]|nr:calmodulin-4-like [Lepeophtheirus salmonis]